MTAIQLAVTEYGSGPPLAILHGLFGSGRNWRSIAQQLAARHRVLTFDLRNHGASPWAERMSYGEMIADLRASLHARGIAHTALLGHSMGGKVAMLAALRYPAEVDRLVVVDIAPAPNPPALLAYVRAMRAVDVHGVTRRGDVDAIERDFPEIVGFLALPAGSAYRGPTLFVAGARSDHIRPEHEPGIRQLFPRARITRIEEAGHWVHAEQPQAFLEAVEAFLSAGVC